MLTTGDTDSAAKESMLLSPTMPEDDTKLWFKGADAFISSFCLSGGLSSWSEGLPNRRVGTNLLSTERASGSVACSSH